MERGSIIGTPKKELLFIPRKTGDLLQQWIGRNLSMTAYPILSAVKTTIRAKEAEKEEVKALYEAPEGAVVEYRGKSFFIPGKSTDLIRALLEIGSDIEAFEIEIGEKMVVTAAKIREALSL